MPHEPGLRYCSCSSKCHFLILDNDPDNPKYTEHEKKLGKDRPIPPAPLSHVIKNHIEKVIAGL